MKKILVALTMMFATSVCMAATPDADEWGKETGRLVGQALHCKNLRPILLGLTYGANEAADAVYQDNPQQNANMRAQMTVFAAAYGHDGLDEGQTCESVKAEVRKVLEKNANLRITYTHKR